MSTIKSKLISGALVSLVSLFLVACGSSDNDDSDDNPQPTMNIVQTAVADGSFSTLVAALQAAELDDDLAGDGPFTVFAPTDDAFNLLPAGTIDFLLEPANKDALANLLTYHVIGAKVSESDALALNGTGVEMLNTLNVRIDDVDGALILNLNGNREAEVIIADIETTNGVIHVIDAVLDPEDAVENIVDTAAANGNFTTLVAALQAAELDDDLAGPGPFTVFAPTDDAFNMLPPGTIDTLLDPANQALLVDILTYHVFNGSVLSPAAIALDGQSVTMLNGKSLSLDVAAGALTLNLGGNRQATVVITDILTANGVIHVIDTVLDPEDSSGPPEPTMNIVETAVADGRFTTLVAALQAAELDDDLAAAGPFTVFAPTDDAFNKLPSGTVDTLLDPANRAVLADILTYHVITGEVRSPEAIALDGQSVTMLNGGNVALDVVNGELILNRGGNRQATVIITDILTTNGVIHVIDTVLDPDDTDLAPAPTMNIVETAVDDGRFTTLVAALQAAELDDDLAAAGPFTVFAPTDDAFNNLPPGTIDTLLDPANQAVLIDILTYHVLTGEVRSPEAIALDGQSVTMLNSGNVALDVVNGELVLNRDGNRPATVIITDILTSNGVIHVIDAVLDPADSTGSH